MHPDEYTQEVLRTYAGTTDLHEQLTLSTLGLAGEAGEVADHLKKVLFQGHPLDTTHLIEELGDLLWYLTLACHALNVSIEEVMQANVDKLRTRYPNGFESERSHNR